jgi:hypothetical protein
MAGRAREKKVYKVSVTIVPYEPGTSPTPEQRRDAILRIIAAAELRIRWEHDAKKMLTGTDPRATPRTEVSMIEVKKGLQVSKKFEPGQIWGAICNDLAMAREFLGKRKRLDKLKTHLADTDYECLATALWRAAVVGYMRCFKGGNARKNDYRLVADSIFGATSNFRKFHKKLEVERDKYLAHADWSEFEVAKVDLEIVPGEHSEYKIHFRELKAMTRSHLDVERFEAVLGAALIYAEREFHAAKNVMLTQQDIDEILASQSSSC